MTPFDARPSPRLLFGAGRLVELPDAAQSLGAANILLCLAPWMIALAAAGPAEVSRWYSDGGYFMHAVLLMSLGQVAAGIALTTWACHRAVPLPLLFLAPAATVLVGTDAADGPLVLGDGTRHLE